MTPLETHDLLTFVSAYDNRRFDDATVYAWHEALGDVSFEDGRRAVIEHFANSTEYLMPAHVRLGAIRIRNDRPAPTRLEIEAAPVVAVEDRSEETNELIRQLRDSLPNLGREVFRRPEWIRHRKLRNREWEATPNPHFVALPPPDGHPLPEEAEAS